MIGLEDRQSIAHDIEVAHHAGARLRLACQTAGIDLRTLQRWKAGQGLVAGDGRPGAVRPIPAHALTQAEREQILRVANEPRFAALPPARIVPMLADEGQYLASEASFQRVLRAHGQTRHRGRAKAPRNRRLPTTHVARAPRELWSWDMTFLPAQVGGCWFYLYLIMDVFSRKIVGFEVHDSDDSDHAAHLVKRTALAENIHALEVKPVLHGDNGATLKATTVLAMLYWLGVKPSYSRPRVSDDNAFVESLFRTAKYRPEFPPRGFATLDDARIWAARFVHWYNHEHRHSGIRYVSPAQRHAGQDQAILAARHRVYSEARERNPRRWSRTTRNWEYIDTVTLNPERECVIKPHSPVAPVASDKPPAAA
jgi:transposase InsO family protein